MHTRKCRNGGYTTYPNRGDGTRLIQVTTERRQRTGAAGEAAGSAAGSGSGIGGGVPGGRAGGG